MNNLNEASLGRVARFLTEGIPFVIVTAELYDKTDEENLDRTIRLRKEIRNVFDLGFTMCRGRYYMQSAKKWVTERSNIVCSIDKGEDYLFDFALAVGEKYEQESVLFCDSKGQAYFLYTMGGLKGHMEKLGKFTTHNLTEYYTKVGKKKFKFDISDTVINEYNITESEYGNTYKNMSEFMSFKILKKKLNTLDFDSFCDFYKKTSTGDK